MYLCLSKVKEQNLLAETFVENYGEIRHVEFSGQFTETAKASFFHSLQPVQCEVRKKPSFIHHAVPIIIFF